MTELPAETVPSDAELRARLTPLQYQVTREKGTERAHTGAYAHHKEAGVYRCVCCGADLFSSTTKYDSGSGWPSFWLPLAGDNVHTHTGDTVWSETEVTSVCESESRPTHGIVGVRTRGINQRQEVVCEFARSFLIPKASSSRESFPGTDEPWNV